MCTYKIVGFLDALCSGERQQYDCVAHQKLCDPTTSEPDLEDLKQLIGTPPILNQATGNSYAVALLRRLFKAMNLPTFRPAMTGSVAGVSYVLLCQQREYCFRGIPDFVMHKDVFGVGHILVATGEIQSTNRPDEQNSIYGIGTLLNSFECGADTPIVCITLFKKKSATLSVARLTPAVASNVAGSVTLKYIVSPAPLYLENTASLKDFAAARTYVHVHDPASRVYIVSCPVWSRHETILKSI